MSTAGVGLLVLFPCSKQLEKSLTIKTTGEISDKDERNDEKDAPVDLAKVVKLEYRDKHGRLVKAGQAQTQMAFQQVAAGRDGSTPSRHGALTATPKATGKGNHGSQDV